MRVTHTFLLLISVATSLGAAPQPIPSQHIPPPQVLGRKLGRLPATNELRITLSLPIRNTVEMDRVLAEIYDPASTNYHRYLTPEEFNRRFGPSSGDYAQITDFCRQHGLFIEGTTENRRLLKVRGSVAACEAAFHTRLSMYRHATEDRDCYAPEVEPTIDSSVSVLHVTGLDNIAKPRAHHTKRALEGMIPQSGTGPGSFYIGSDFRKSYAPGVSLTGTGESVALVEFDGFYAADIAMYLQEANLAAVPVKTVLVDGFSGSPGSDNGEVALDIEVAIAMAPGLKSVISYEASHTSNPADILNRIVQDNAARQISCSWTWGAYHDPTIDQILQQMGAQGQSFFTAAGDTLAYSSGIDAPADSPYLTSVGGTILTNTSSQAWVNEFVWNDSDGITGTGGGVSTYYSLPTWQNNVATTSNGASRTKRNIPDVALTASGVISVADNGTNYITEGTSVAAPLWAAFTALANQKAMSLGKPALGFLNPAIYAIGRTNPPAFHDITVGNNTNSSNPTNFYAQAGYDLCTGWGTPAGNSLITALVPDDPSQVDHFQWDPLPAQMSNGVAVTATIRAISIGGWLATNYSATASISAGTIQSNCFYSGDFESGTWTPWTSDGGIYTRTVDTTTGANGTHNSFTLIGGANASYNGVALALSNARPAHVEFYVKAKATNLACGYVVAGDGGSRTASAFHFRLDSTGIMGLASPDGTLLYGIPYQSNTWYKVRLDLDWTRKAVDYYVNDVRITSGLAFPNTNLTGIVVAQLFNYNYAQAWWDQIRFYSDTTITPVATTPGDISFSRGQWSGPVTATQDAANVWFTVTDSQGRTGATGPVLIGQPPQVVFQPQSVTVAPGGNATLTVSATGSNPLCYQWQRNGITIGGATNATLVLNGVQAADGGGRYACTVSNFMGSAVSQAASITVLPLLGSISPVANGGVQMSLSGTPGASYTLQTSSDLHTWMDYLTLTLTNGTSSITDTNQLPMRFYRLKLN